MSSEPETKTTNYAWMGLVIAAAVTLLGLLLMTAAQAAGSPGWVWSGYLLLSAAALAAYWWRVYQPQQGLRAEVERVERDGDAVEGTLVLALDRLRTGDLVNCARQAQQLPGRIADAFARSTDALETLARQIQESSLDVAGAAQSVNEISADLASGSSEQAASVVEITAAMEELARTAAQIAENAFVQAELAQAAEESGNAGQQAVEEAVTGVEEVRKRITGIAGRADSLGARSKEIYQVLDLITEIAQETHMLSLNAAIEAAAAGEHGRRFSVVAEEVRRLAQRSQESVESVRNLLDEFAGSIRATIVATEEGSTEASRVLDRVRAAAAAIEELRGTSSDTARVAREISLATQQQNAASDEVVLTLKEASQVVQRMADSLKQFTEAADRLHHLGLVIQMLAQSLHLESPHSLKHVAETWAEEVKKRLGRWEAIERLVADLVSRHPYVECLYFYDARNQQNALVANRQLLGDREVPLAVLQGEGFEHRPWYVAATTEGQTILTPVFESLLSGRPIFTAAAPVYAGGELAGVLGLDINIDSWTKI